MPEEFIDDILSGNAEQSSSTETVANAAEVDKSPDQSSKQTETNNNDASDSGQSNQPTVEELASQLGWRADHVGEDAVDAATYILRSKDIQKSMSTHNKDLKKQLDALNSSVDALRTHNERVYQADVKRLQAEITALKKARRAAVELADVEKVDELDEQIEEHQKNINESKLEENKNVQPSSNPDYDEWIEDNQWYLEDDEMATYANNVAVQYEGAPPARIYAIVRQKVQELWPERFKTTQPKVAQPVQKAKPIGPASPVERSTNNKSSANNFTKADLTPEQVQIMNQFVRGGIMTEEQYINDIAKMQEA